MNVSTFAVTAEEAEAKTAEYEAVPEARRGPFDHALLRAYRAARDGKTLVHLNATIEWGGRFDNGAPRMAIARADATECFVSRWTWPHTGVVYSSIPRPRWRGNKVGKNHVAVDLPDSWRSGNFFSGRTLVPLVPPDCRPARSLNAYHVLWEVETWNEWVAPGDPYLVRHLMGDLWVVHAEWDLTELERAVLARGIFTAP